MAGKKVERAGEWGVRLDTRKFMSAGIEGLGCSYPANAIYHHLLITFMATSTANKNAMAITKQQKTPSNSLLTVHQPPRPYDLTYLVK